MIKNRSLKVILQSVAIKLFVIQLIIAAAALLANILSARTLGPEARGELSLFMQIAYLSNVICVLGRHRSYLKVGSKTSISVGASFRDIRKLSGAPLLISIVIALVTSCVVGFSGLSFSVSLFFGLFFLIYSGVQQKTFRSGAIVARNATPYFLSSIAGQLLLLAGVVALTYFDDSRLELWIILYGFSVFLPYFLVGALHLVKTSDLGSSAEELQKVKKLGIRLVPLSVAETAGARLDRFLIPVLANFSQLGIYTVVVTMTELIAWPINNYVDSRIPQWTRDIVAGNLKLLKELVRILIAIFVMSLIVGIGLQVSLIRLFGPEYSSGIKLIWPLVLAASLHAFTRFSTNLCISASFNRLANTIPISAMIASAISYLFLVAPFGALGASWGLVIGYSCAVVVSIPGLVYIYRIKGSLKHGGDKREAMG